MPYAYIWNNCVIETIQRARAKLNQIYARRVNINFSSIFVACSRRHSARVCTTFAIYHASIMIFFSPCVYRNLRVQINSSDQEKRIECAISPKRKCHKYILIVTTSFSWFISRTVGMLSLSRVNHKICNSPSFLVCFSTVWRFFFFFFVVQLHNLISTHFQS